MLAAHKEDNDSRQQVQLQMMLAHGEETKLRLIEAQKSADVRLLEAREAADKQMRLLQEMHEMAARCRELETEKSIRREVEEQQVSLAWINSGRAERGRQRSVVQRELERQRPSSVARVGFADSPPLRVRPPHRLHKRSCMTLSVITMRQLLIIELLLVRAPLP